MMSSFYWLFLGLHLAVQPSITAPDVVAKVQAYYAGTTKLKAEFRQEYTNTTYGRTSQSDGFLYIAKPGKMRWDYTGKEKKYFISDGTTLWVYEPAANQVVMQSLADQILPVAITFLYGKGDLKAEFDADLDPGKYGDKDDLVVKLTPKKPDAAYKNLWLVVDPADFHVKQSVILEASNNVNAFRFDKVQQNEKAKVADSLFKFVAPAGVRVVKAEELSAPTGKPKTE